MTQIDDTHLHWKVHFDGVVREWDAEIVDQKPDQQITWRSLDGSSNSGTVLFKPRGDGSTVSVRVVYEPEGFVEKAGELLSFVARRVQGDLERFKEFIELRGAETGEWRGEVRPDDEGPV